MLKYLIIALIFALLFYSPLTRMLRGRPPNRTAAPTQPPARAEQMVQCAHCGVHLPDGDALRDDQGHVYCGAAHRRAGPARSR
jgi:uncharacterized protein